MALSLLILATLFWATPLLAQNTGRPSPQLMQVLLNQEKKQQKRVSALQAQLDLANRQAEDQREKLSQLRRQRRDFEGIQNAENTSSESLPEILRMLEIGRAELLIELSGKEARRDTILKSAKPDPAQLEISKRRLQSVRQLYEIEQEKLDRVKALAAQNSIPMTDLMNQRQAVIEAELRMHEAELASQAGSATAKLNDRKKDQLLSVSLDIAELQAKLDTTLKLLGDLGKFRRVQDDIREIDDLAMPNELDKLVRLQEQISQYEIELRTAEAQLEDYKARVNSVREESSADTNEDPDK